MTALIAIGAVVVYLAVAILIGQFIKAGGRLDPPVPPTRPARVDPTTYQTSRRRRP